MGSEAAAKVITKDTMCPSLTIKQRIYCFLSCFILGLVLSIVSVGGILGAIMNPTKFALLYSFGNLCSLGSTFFLVGPASQFKKMMKKTRIVVSLVFVFSLIGTIVFAVGFYDEDVKWHKLMIILLMIIQACSLFWYTLSYIPFGRKIFKKICFKCCCDDDEGNSSGGSS